MVRVDTPANHTLTILDGIPCLALCSSGRSCVPFDREYAPFTLEKLVKAHSTDPRSLEVRMELDTNVATLSAETA